MPALVVGCTNARPTEDQMFRRRRHRNIQSKRVRTFDRGPNKLEDLQGTGSAGNDLERHVQDTFLAVRVPGDEGSVSWRARNVAELRNLWQVLARWRLDKVRVSFDVTQ
jgi:hypothetical protein